MNNSRPPEPPSADSALWSIVMLIGLTTIAYFPGIGGAFIGDDITNIVLNPMVQLREFSLDALSAALQANHSGPLGRPLPSLSFALNFYFAGAQFDAVAFKLFNVMVHVVNVLLIWVLARQLVRVSGVCAGADNNGTTVATVAALVWALHPLQLTNVLYVVQRMNSMAATFVLVGLIIFIYGRQQLERGDSRGLATMVFGVVGGTALGLTCKENALVLPGLALVAELTLLDRTRGTTPALVKFYVATVALPYAVGVLVAVFWYDLFAVAYANRDFSPYERLLTQPRALWWYIGQWFAPDLTSLSVHHDDYVVSRTLNSPATTAWALIAGAVVSVMAVAARKKLKWFSFAVGWFLMAHAVESSFIPLEMMFEHRNYVPVFGLSLGTSMLVVQGAGYLGNSRLVTRTVATLVVLIVLGSTGLRAYEWGDLPRLVVATAERQPSSLRAQGDLAQLLDAVQTDPAATYRAYTRVSALLPDSANQKMGMMRALARMEVRKTIGASKLPEKILSDDGQVLLDTSDAGLNAQWSRLGAAVEQRLGQPNLKVADLEGAQILVRCFETNQPVCQRFRPWFTRWFNTALSNETIGRHAHQTFHWLKARVMARDGRIDEALVAIGVAVAVDPTLLPFRHHQLALHIRAGRLNAAKTLLDYLRSVEGDARHRLEIAALERMLNIALAARPTSKG